MNERIRLLAKEAGIVIPKDSEYNGHIYRNSIEKFAELIVRECANIALREDHDPYECILAHFGVDE
jgi:hypothetical protein